MMDEVVPSASSRSGATSRHQAQRRSSDRDENNSQRASATETSSNGNVTNNYNSDRRGTGSVAGGGLASMPKAILSKFLLIVTLLVRMLLFPLLRLSKVIFPAGEFDGLQSVTTADRAARAFVHYFTRTYITPLAVNNNEMLTRDCPFVEKGYNSTLTDIATQTVLNESESNPLDESVLSSSPPLLLIYLHSPLHGLSSKFIEDTLCHPQILDTLNRNSLEGTLQCWGGSIHSAEGDSLASIFNVSSFPFLALVKVKPSSNFRNAVNNTNNQQTNNHSQNISLEMHLRIEGKALKSLPVSTLHAYITTALQRHQAALNESLSRRLQRYEEQRLREEQDREFNEALEEDRRREREKQLEQERKLAEEERIRKEAEDVERQKREKLSKARELVGEEPVAGAPDTARIRLMLPSGKRIERRFRADHTVDAIRAYLVLYFEEKGISMENFGLSCNFPKRSLQDRGSVTLKEEGLCPQAVIMIQDLDA